jgi:hypothetical protein
METAGLTVARRRFAGRREAAPLRREDFDALAAALLSPVGPRPAAADDAGPDDAPGRQPPAPLGDPAPPDGLYVLIPAGIDPPGRRRTALEVARRLAPPRDAAAVFVFEGGQVEARVFGEVAAGRLGPQNYLTGEDLGRTVAGLVGQCRQVGIVMLDEPNGRLKGLGAAAGRTVFVATPDPESVIETYRELKLWRRGGYGSQAALLVVGGPGGQEAGRLHRRLRKAVRSFLGCDLAAQGFLACEVPAQEHCEPLRLFSQTPADEVWSRLLAAVQEAAQRDRSPTVTEGPLAAADPSGRDAQSPDGALSLGPASQDPAAPNDAGHDPASGAAGSRTGSPPAPPPPAPLAPIPPAPPAVPDICPVFSPWHPADRGELLAAVEAQAPSLVASGLRLVFRVDVDEPGAPPLAAVRDDGALVAILLTEPGAAVDTAAAERWLAAHRSLLARAYPSAGIAGDARASAVVLAPLEPPADGFRRFLPIRMGGHRGVVILP